MVRHFSRNEEVAKFDIGNDKCKPNYIEHLINAESCANLGTSYRAQEVVLTYRLTGL